jgi:ubiquitin-conjugating enzyme E2 S
VAPSTAPTATSNERERGEGKRSLNSRKLFYLIFYSFSNSLVLSSSPFQHLGTISSLIHCICVNNSNKLLITPIMAPSNVENFSPHVIKQITRELGELTKNPLEGIRVIFNEDDITSIQADIDGPPGTPYHGGSFRIRLVLGKNFPSTPPKGFFVTKIFHPNVGRNGEICVNTLKKDWKQDLGIKHILLTVKCLLIVPNPESALNEEAGKMLLEQYDDYCKRAKMMTEIHAPKQSDKMAEDCQVVADECQQQQPVPSSSLNNLGISLLDCYHTTTTTTTNTADQQQHAANSPQMINNNNINSNNNNNNNTSNCNNLTSNKSSTTASQQSSSSQPPKVAIASTAINKNRGLKRVLRLRS